MFPATTRERSMTRRPWSIPLKSGLKEVRSIVASLYETRRESPWIRTRAGSMAHLDERHRCHASIVRRSRLYLNCQEMLQSEERAHGSVRPQVLAGQSINEVGHDDDAVHDSFSGNSPGASPWQRQPGADG